MSKAKKISLDLNELMARLIKETGVNQDNPLVTLRLTGNATESPSQRNQVQVFMDTLNKAGLRQDSARIRRVLLPPQHAYIWRSWIRLASSTWATWV